MQNGRRKPPVFVWLFSFRCRFAGPVLGQRGALIRVLAMTTVRYTATAFFGVRNSPLALSRI